MIRVFEPRVTINDTFSVLKTLLKNNISGTSPTVGEFENKLADKFERKHAVAVSNGSTALDLAFQSLDLKEGDEVIVPSFTIISCLSAIIRAGATPVFCEVDNKSWNMTLNNVIDKKTNRTRAVLMVHLYGLAAEAEATIDTYLNSAVGIGEHPQVMQELRKQIEILGEARDGIDTIITLQNRNKPKTQLNG